MIIIIIALNAHFFIYKNYQSDKNVIGEARVYF